MKRISKAVDQALKEDDYRSALDKLIKDKMKEAFKAGVEHDHYEGIMSARANTFEIWFSKKYE